MEMLLPPLSDPLVAGHQHKQGTAELVSRNYMAGFQPEVWAGLFRDSLEMLKPLLSWTSQALHRDHWWEVALAQGTVVVNLC